MTAPGDLAVVKRELPDFEPVRRSPAHRLHVALNARFDREGAWEVPLDYGDAEGERTAARDGLALVDVTARAKVDLRGALDGAAGLATFQPGRLGRLGDTTTAFVATVTDAWALLLGPAAEEEALVARAESHAGPGLMVTDAGSLFAAFALAGPRTPDLLRRLVGIDPDSLEADACAATQVAQIWGLLVRPNAEVVEVYAGSEYGRYLWERLLEIGRPLSIRPAGWRALRDRGWS